MNQTDINCVAYIVIVSGGQYEDAWQIELVASLEHDKAKSYMETQIQAIEKWRKKQNEYEELMQKFHEEFAIKNEELAKTNIDEWMNKSFQEEQEYMKKVVDQLELNIEMKDYYDQGVSFDIKEVKLV